jgi:maleylacetoacetate isomerase
MSDIVLYDYWRSSAAYRVRIALHLKGIAYRTVPLDLVEGDQRSPDYLARNPQGLVPALEIDGHFLTQSLAIIDYLDARHKAPPMVPSDPAARSAVLAKALVIAADIHPINNLRVLNYLRGTLGMDDEAVGAWYCHWIAEGFIALEQGAPDSGLFGGAEPDLVDVCLVPQMTNARRFDMALDMFPRLVRIDAALRELPAYVAAAPDAAKP